MCACDTFSESYTATAAFALCQANTAMFHLLAALQCAHTEITHTHTHTHTHKHKRTHTHTNTEQRKRLRIVSNM